MNEHEINSGGKMKKRKVKAWCSECFQSFENGPYTKICKEHVTRGRCGAVDCRKQIFNRGDSQCIRKFPNSNSENRHTYCISHEEAMHWKDFCNIQNCLGVKRSAEINYELGKISNFAEKRALDFDNVRDLAEKTDKNYQHEKTISNIKESNTKDPGIKKEFSYFDNLFPNLEYNLIDDIKNLTFFEGEKFSLDDNLINEFNNFYFNTSDIAGNIVNKDLNGENKILGVVRTKTKTDTDTNTIKPEIYNKSNEEKIEKEENINNAKNKYSNNIYTDSKISDTENIESIFDKVHSDTKIPKSILNKLKSAFKKKGILNAKILRLFKEKNKNFNFLVAEFGKICTQIEGVALFLENIL